MNAPDSVISSIINEKGCMAHEAHRGEPCWEIIPAGGMRGEFNLAICDKRARKAGWAHAINPESLGKPAPDTNRPGHPRR